MQGKLYHYDRAIYPIYHYERERQIWVCGPCGVCWRPTLVLEAPEEIDRGGPLIAATAAYFQMAVDAVFEANRRAVARRGTARRGTARRGAASLPKSLLQGHKEILRHIAPQPDAPAPQLGARA